MRRPLMGVLEEVFEYESDDALTVFLTPRTLLSGLGVSPFLLLMSYHDLRWLTTKRSVLTLAKSEAVPPVLRTVLKSSET